MNGLLLGLERINEKNLNKYYNDVKYILKLQVEQGKWNVGKNDIFIFIKSEQVHFYLIKKTFKTGEERTIGSISVFDNEKFAMIGSFIVEAELRGQGIGQHIFSNILKIHNINFGTLLSEPGREAFYERNGFHDVNKPFCKFSHKVEKMDTLNLTLDKIDISYIDKLIEFDKKHTGIDRKSLLQNMVAEPENVTYITLNDESTITGYGILRPLQNGYRVSIYALSFENFREIFGRIINHLSSSIKSQKAVSVFIDCPVAKEAKLLSQGFSEEGQYALMFKNNMDKKLPLGLSGEYTWGILTEECG